MKIFVKEDFTCCTGPSVQAGVSSSTWFAPRAFQASLTGQTLRTERPHESRQTVFTVFSFGSVDSYKSDLVVSLRKE